MPKPSADRDDLRLATERRCVARTEARDDERKAEAEAQGERLVRAGDPKHQGNGRVDVGDDRRAHRSDLVDEGEEDEEGEQAGNKGEGDERAQSPQRRGASGRLEKAKGA